MTSLSSIGGLASSRELHNAGVIGACNFLHATEHGEGIAYGWIAPHKS